ncbi:MAG: hypothetical protein MJK12_15255 [Colwellia sp.]|nr:hypothetical protein [Colwellia sp.]
MNKINNKILLSVGAGMILGVIFLVINLIFSSGESSFSSSANVNEQVFILTDNTNNTDNLLLPLLMMFGFNVDTLNGDNIDELALTLENISVRIVAQSRVGEILHTLLEIVTPAETKRITVTEGTVVNGFLIKSITNKQLRLEKDNEEFVIKLFHPQELNQNRLENDLK